MNNNVTNPMLITREGLEDLNHEHNNLRNVKRPEAVKRIAAAREQGDLSENSEYTAAKEDLAFIDGRIVELEEILHRAKLIQTKHSKNSVDLGCKVKLHTSGKSDIYTIVGEWEANPKDKKISHSSPLGKALLGKKVGEQIEVEAPVGKIVYKVLEIE